MNNLNNSFLNLFAVAFCVGGLSLVAMASPDEAQLKAVSKCITCHGESGKSTVPLFPNLAGQKKEYLVKQIKSFRDGHRKDHMMSPMAQGLSDADVENQALYFSSMK